MKILSIFGTRPEAIKLAPVIHELARRANNNGVRSVTCVTAQHRQMLDQVLDILRIRPDIDLNLMQEDQTLGAISAEAMTSVTEVLKRERPDLVLVQGDTTTAMVASLAASYEKIAVGHIEAGLRTTDRYSPFPEEINRRIIGVLASHHFAPTQRAADNLRREGVRAEDIFVTGNTVVDALLWVVDQPLSAAARELLNRLGIPEGEGRADLPPGENSDRRSRGPSKTRSSGGRLRTILVTAHRRENFGRPFEFICKALRALTERNPEVQLIYPVHMNPRVREPVGQILQGQERIHLVEPLPYDLFVQLMKRVYLIITDSGGIQEEAPTLGKPVLVVRRETERPEAVEAGCVKIVGTNPDRIIAETERLLRDEREYEQMARAISPYGDGRAAERILQIISAELGISAPVFA